MSEANEITQKFLDSSQYLEQSILQYELVYGEDFVSPGGAQLARELIAEMQLQPGARVLDAGCGLGGSAFLMAREFGLLVEGIDLSRNMLELAARKLAAHGLAPGVDLQWGDCLELDRPGRYDAIYSRDVFLHIHDKARLFAVLESSLRPGGMLLFTDYCCGPAPWSDEFADYVEARGYRLHTVDEYLELIRAAGFEAAAGEDLSARFVEILKADLERIDGLDLEPGSREKLRQAWQQKLVRAGTGDHRWGKFCAYRAGATAA